MLNLTEHEQLRPAELTPPERRRSPTVALLLSMLFPGLGHLYVGLRRNALWLVGCEGTALAIMTYGSGSLHGQSILVVPSLYCFAMADAYFSARERNAGATSLLIRANPRITATLNLLTKGFGYFYLGDRIKGIVCFLVIGAAQIALLLRINVWTSAFAITMQIAVAADGYRVARQRLLANHPNLDRSQDGGPGPIELANPTGFAARHRLSLFPGLRYDYSRRVWCAPGAGWAHRDHHGHAGAGPVRTPLSQFARAY